MRVRVRVRVRARARARARARVEGEGYAGSRALAGAPAWVSTSDRSPAGFAPVISPTSTPPR